MSVCESYSVSFAATQPHHIYTSVSVFIVLLIRHRTIHTKHGRVRMHVLRIFVCRNKLIDFYVFLIFTLIFSVRSCPLYRNKRQSLLLHTHTTRNSFSINYGKTHVYALLFIFLFYFCVSLFFCSVELNFVCVSVCGVCVCKCIEKNRSVRAVIALIFIQLRHQSWGSKPKLFLRWHFEDLASHSSAL